MTLRGISPIGVAGLVLALAADLWLLTVVGSELLPDTSAGSDRIEWKTNVSLPPDAARHKPIDAYREILARPAFFKSREPFVAPSPPPPVAAVPAPAPAPVDPGLVLGGVMIRNDSRKAYVVSRAGANGAWIKVGEEFQGWKLVAIRNGAVRLEQMGRSIELPLYPEQ